MWLTAKITDVITASVISRYRSRQFLFRIRHGGECTAGAADRMLASSAYRSTSSSSDRVQFAGC
jgi:hypothetical protein